MCEPANEQEANGARGAGKRESKRSGPQVRRPAPRRRRR